MKVFNRATSRAAGRPSPAGLGGLLLLATLAACARPSVQLQPHEIKADTASAVDGMLLKDYPGPKGQIIYSDGKTDFFCDTVEMVSAVLTPEQKRPIAAVFTQDMGKTDWRQPVGHWIDARTAFYVVGSKKPGGMGSTFGTFSIEKDAQAFAQKEGGKVLHFKDITPAMAQIDGGVVHDAIMSH